MFGPIGVIPAKAGSHAGRELTFVGPGFRRDDMQINQIANFLASPSGRSASYSSNGWWIHGLVGSISTK